MKTLIAVACLAVALLGVSMIATLASAPSPAPVGTPATLAMMASPVVPPVEGPLVINLPEQTVTAVAPKPMRHASAVLAPRATSAATHCDPFGPRSVCEYRDLQGGSGGRVLACECR